MPEMDTTEFKFPDEQDAKPAAKAQEEESFEIEIEDDTPAEDRGRAPLPKPLVEELDKDELEQYDDNVKARLKQMRKVWHDERREKEAALREQQEAINVAKKLLEENTRIRNMLSTGEKIFVNTVQSAATMELEAAKKAYKEAYESGDSDRLLEATQALQEAGFKVKQAQNFQPVALQPQETIVQTPQIEEPVSRRADPKAEEWQERNPWFGPNKGMTAYALGLHEELKANGVVIGSNEYYNALDRTMRKRFPEAFGLEEEQSREQVRSKPATVVAPATRSTASNKIKLRGSQVQLAKKLGLTPEQYWRELVKVENQNG